MQNFDPLFLCDKNGELLLTQHVAHRLIGIVSEHQEVRAIGISVSTQHAAFAPRVGALTRVVSSRGRTSNRPTPEDAAQCNHSEKADQTA
jgi:hypothetical protein